MDTYLHHPYAYTSFKLAESNAVARSTIPISTGAPTYVYSHIPSSKNKSFNIFWGALSEGPRGSTPASSNSSPRATYRRIFSRLSTSILTKGFTLAQPPPTPLRQQSSHPPPRVTYPMIFSRLSTSSLTKAFTQALPTSNVTPTPTLSSDSPPRLTYPTIFSRLSTSIYPSFKKVVLRHSLPPTPPLRQHHLRIPLHALPTLRFFPASLPLFTQIFNGFTQALLTSNAVFAFPSSRYPP